jgi:sulfatase modifying factor 1
VIFIPAGPFIMGSDDGNYDEQPVREVYVDSFSIDQCPVTNAEYKRFIDATGYKAPNLGLHWSQKYDWVDRMYPAGKADCPVVLITWHDAMAYCRWAGKRLPTEAEWEKAARGLDGRIWPWGNNWDGTNLAGSGVGDTQPVGQYKSGMSPMGCLDMAGNVWEWTSDWYGDKYYREAPARNPHGPESGAERVLKGGAWIHSSFSVRGAMRFHKSPEYCDNYIGFRCVASHP